MLNKNDAVATIAVKNIDVARKFYEGVLGLTPEPEAEEGVLSFKTGRTTVLVYTSQYAGTNRATSATWNVDDLEGIISSLKSKGVKFEHYDLPGVTRKGDVHGTGNTRAAWFKDPDGNIIALAAG